MKLIKFKSNYNNEVYYYYIEGVIIAGKRYRTDYDSSLSLVIKIAKTKNMKNLNTIKIKHIKEIIFNLKFNNFEDLLELIPEEFL